MDILRKIANSARRPMTTSSRAVLVTFRTALWLAALAAELRAADTEFDRGAAGVSQSLQQLQTTATVLHVVAHPDDEDGGMLTYCARGLGARTTLFSMTRGEGGANLISSNFFDELGILRTLEHLEAARYYGINLRYSHAVDYGFSKTLDEALDQWSGGGPILEDLVRVVRQEHPDVIVARFRGDARDGHGHHQLSGVLAQHVLEAAADPDRFPEQIAAGLHPWKPRKLYANNIHPRWRPEDQNVWTIAVPTGEFHPVLGRSYAQIARHGLGFQRSQGISGHDGPAGESQSYYRLTRPDPGPSPVREVSFFDGIDTSITGLAQTVGANPPAWLGDGLSRIQAAVNGAVEKYNLREPGRIVSELTQGLEQTRRLLARIADSTLPPDVRQHLALVLGRKESQFADALRRCLGLDLAVIADASQSALEPNPFGFRESTFHSAIPGQELAVRVRVVNRSRIPLTVTAARLQLPAHWSTTPLTEPATSLKYNIPWTADFAVKVGDNAVTERPYWRRDSIREPYYHIDRPAEAGLPLGQETQVRGQVTIRVEDVEFSLEEEARVSFRDPGFGLISDRLTIVPRLSVSFDAEYGIVPRSVRRYPVRVVVRSQAVSGSQGTLRLKLPTGFASEPQEQEFSIARAGEEQSREFLVAIPEQSEEGEITVQAVAECNGKMFAEGYTTITARDLGRNYFFRPALKRLRVVDVKVAEGLRVGYVMGSGDNVPLALGELGVQTHLLDSADLATGDLGQFDAIVIGVRAYAVRSDLEASNARLLQYVHDGGTLVVQYQTPEFDRNFGPYPYKMGNNPEEVSEEDAVVTLLDPGHPLMTSPNQITSADFDGWAEQRGSKFWQTWDDRYVPLWECHDRGQPAQKGGMLYTRYGKGAYLYSAYAWYRQLPMGVPGAYRIYANLISHRAQPGVAK